MNSVDSVKTVFINNNETSETITDTNRSVVIRNSGSINTILFIVIVSFLCGCFIAIIVLYLLVR
jgi:hypothetical protein